MTTEDGTCSSDMRVTSKMLTSWKLSLSWCNSEKQRGHSRLTQDTGGRLVTGWSAGLINGKDDLQLWPETEAWRCNVRSLWFRKKTGLNYKGWSAGWWAWGGKIKILVVAAEQMQWGKYCMDKWTTMVTATLMWSQ